MHISFFYISEECEHSQLKRSWNRSIYSQQDWNGQNHFIQRNHCSVAIWRCTCGELGRSWCPSDLMTIFYCNIPAAICQNLNWPSLPSAGLRRNSGNGCICLGLFLVLLSILAKIHSEISSLEGGFWCQKLFTWNYIVTASLFVGKFYMALGLCNPRPVSYWCSYWVSYQPAPGP